MNVIDKVIGFFDPAAGLRRAQMRGAMNTVARSFDAAKKDKRTKGWKIIDDQHTEMAELLDVRKRSRDLFLNNPYASKAHRSFRNNIVGTGILPAIANEKLKGEWKEWAESVEVDYDEQLDFYGLTGLVTMTTSIQGQCLVLRIKTRSRKRVPLELKVLPSSYLDTSKDTLATASGGWIKGGIEFYPKGKRKGYWIYDQDPSGSKITSTFWKKEDVAHVYELIEPGQLHGIPNGSPSIMTLRDYDDYAAAQLTRQKIAACFSVFITETSNESVDLLGDEGKGKGIERVQPGIIERLEPGQQVTFASPPPAEGYGEYSHNILTGAASGFNVTYEGMTGDFSHVNFTSGRMGAIEQGKNNEAVQWFTIIPKYCRVVWGWFMDAAIISGRISEKDAVRSIGWTAPRREMVDPVKEINGMLAAIRAGLMSWQEAVRMLGYTPEEILEELKQAKKLFDDAGLQPESDPRYDVKTPFPASGDDTEKKSK